MHLAKMHRSILKLKNVRLQSTVRAVLETDEYTATPEYPPIVDQSLEARIRRSRENTYEKIRKLNTVEEKQIGLNMPRYYGFKSTILTDCKVPFGALPLVSAFTRTHLETEGLPQTYAEYEAEAAKLASELKGPLEDVIALVLENVQFIEMKYSLDKTEQEQKEDAITKIIVRQINRIITNKLADSNPHILSAQVDYDPRHEAFWVVGGIDPSRYLIWSRMQKWWTRPKAHDPENRAIQYLGRPLLTLRNGAPLKPLLPYTEAVNPNFAVDKFTYHPQSVGYFVNHRHATNIPGFWPGDPDEFGLLSIHGRGHISVRKESFGEEDNIEALHCQALTASYGWLLAQANLLGFNTYNDLTYPLVTQTAITNGQLWSLYAYQLNTIVMHNEQVDENLKHNVCYGTKPLKLYEGLENGKIVGFNEDVLKNILQMYLNAPEERDYDMKPYLSKTEPVVADIEDDKRRNWLEKCYKHLCSNRPRHKLLPEIYDWEKIYKIKFNMRFQEAKYKPFEKGESMWKRRLNEHLPPYIPKVLRPYPKCRKKFEDTYYPDV